MLYLCVIVVPFSLMVAFSGGTLDLLGGGLDSLLGGGGADVGAAPAAPGVPPTATSSAGTHLLSLYPFPDNVFYAIVRAFPFVLSWQAIYKYVASFL